MPETTRRRWAKRLRQRAQPACRSRVAAVLDAWRDLGGDVIFTRFHNEPGSPYERLIHWTRMQGPPDTDITSELDPFVAAAVDLIDKPHYTLFTPAGTAAVRKGDWRDIVFCGVATDGCVLSRRWTRSSSLHPLGLDRRLRESCRPPMSMKRVSPCFGASSVVDSSWTQRRCSRGSSGVAARTRSAPAAASWGLGAQRFLTGPPTRASVVVEEATDQLGLGQAGRLRLLVQAVLQELRQEDRDADHE